MSGSSTTSIYSTIYAFGGSYSDAGNVSISTDGAEPVSPPYYSETYGSVTASVFSNGPVWVQDLSELLGLGQLAPSLAGGGDFAYGGAEAGSEPQNAGNLNLPALSVPSQLAQFAASVGHASPTALFTVSVGGGDIFDILANPALSAADQATDVTDAVNNELADISTMYRDGMRNLLVLNVEDLGVVPYVTEGFANGSGQPSAALDALATSLSSSYDAQLASGLAALAQGDGFNYNVVATNNLVDSAASAPAAYGYNNVTSPVWSGGFTSEVRGALSSTAPTSQNQNLFFDQFHLTESGHADLANLAYTEINPTYVLEADLTTGVQTANLALPYLGPDTSLHTEFAAVTPDNVALFATTPGTFLQTGTGDNILVAQSGTNVLTTSVGSSYLASGTGSDTFFIATSATTSSWNEIANFHSGDVLSVLGYQPGVSQAVWNTVPGIDGAVLNVNLAGTGSVWASDTFLGVSLSTAQSYATSVTPVSGTGVYTVYA